MVKRLEKILPCKTWITNVELWNVLRHQHSTGASQTGWYNRHVSDRTAPAHSETSYGTNGGKDNPMKLYKFNFFPMGTLKGATLRYFEFLR